MAKCIVYGPTAIQNASGSDVEVKYQASYYGTDVLYGCQSTEIAPVFEYGDFPGGVLSGLLGFPAGWESALVAAVQSGAAACANASEGTGVDLADTDIGYPPIKRG